MAMAADFQKEFNWWFGKGVFKINANVQSVDN